MNGLSFPTLLALRYLKSTRRDAAVTFLSAVAAGGIALGVAALVVALAGLAGLQRALRAEIVARTSQIEIELPSGSEAGAVLRAVVATAGVESAQLLRRGRGWLLASGTAHPVELVGFERRPPASFPQASGVEPGLYVGEALAQRLGLAPGAAVELLAARPTLTPLGPQPRLRSLRLSGTFRSGRTERWDRVALPLPLAESLLPSAVAVIEVSAGGLDQALALAARLSGRLPAGSRVRTWRDLNRPLFFALLLERAVLFIAVFLIVLVASLALVADLALIQASKRREVGALAAIGASPAALRAAFTRLGGLLAALGVAAGGLLGALASWLFDRYRLLALPGDVYFLDYLPFDLQLTDLAVVASATLALALGASFWAARRAAQLPPAEALRA